MPLPEKPHSPLRQAALQIAAAVIILSLALPYAFATHGAPPFPQTAFLIGGLAFLMATQTRAPLRWRMIQLIFAPLCWAFLQLPISPNWFLVIFIVLFLFYRGAVSGQIPLYLSNQATAKALAIFVGEQFSSKKTPHFLDLGAGLGSVLRPLAKSLPNAQLIGVENAPASWLIGKILCGQKKNIDWCFGSLWDTRTDDCDVVYAFLSPAPREKLWEKLSREMSPNSWFISNSFAVPNVEPTEILALEDMRQTKLYCYQMK